MIELQPHVMEQDSGTYSQSIVLLGHLDSRRLLYYGQLEVIQSVTL